MGKLRLDPIRLGLEECNVQCVLNKHLFQRLVQFQVISYENLFLVTLILKANSKLTLILPTMYIIYHHFSLLPLHTFSYLEFKGDDITHDALFTPYFPQLMVLYNTNALP